MHGLTNKPVENVTGEHKLKLERSVSWCLQTEDQLEKSAMLV